MKIGHIVQKPIVQKLHKHTNYLVDSTTLLGVEVEVENYIAKADSGAKAAGYWEIKEDGSLRNHGIEFAFYEPLYGADAVAAITWLFAEAKRCGWKISKLTGAHVHIDVRDMEVNAFRVLCAVYAITEPLIYKWVGSRRDVNMFCLPWYMADGEMDRINKSLTTPDATTSLAFLKGLSKYSGLNVGAAVKFGTIEFRMLETTFDETRFVDWLNILLSLRVYACKWADKTPEWVCERLVNLGSRGFVEEVFGKTLVSKMWYDDYYKDAVGLGMVTCDWFLENTKSLQLNNTQTLAERFALMRIKNMALELSSNDHSGLKKFQNRTTSKKPKKAARSTVKAPQLGQPGQTSTWYDEGTFQIPEAVWNATPSPPLAVTLDDLENQ